MQMVSNKKCPSSDVSFNSEADLAADVIKLIRVSIEQKILQCIQYIAYIQYRQYIGYIAHIIGI